MYWYFVLGILFLVSMVAVVYAINNRQNREYILYFLVIVFTIIFVISIILLFVTLDYRKFITSYNLQQDSPTFTPIVNAQLADYQARKSCFGNWSIIPEQVFDLKPLK